MSDAALGAPWSLLHERTTFLCRTCLRPITWETRTEPGYNPREGWYDDCRVDALICFSSRDYRHVPLTDREWAYYEAGEAHAREHEAGIAAAVESLAGEYEDIGKYRIPSYEDGETIATDLRAALTSTGASEALAKRDARVRGEALRESADEIDGVTDGAEPSADWLRERADRSEAEAGGDR